MEKKIMRGEHKGDMPAPDPNPVGPDLNFGLPGLNPGAWEPDLETPDPGKEARFLKRGVLNPILLILSSVPGIPVYLNPVIPEPNPGVADPPPRATGPAPGPPHLLLAGEWSRQEGAALVEVVLAVAFFSVILAALLSFYTGSLQSWWRGCSALDRQQNARIAMDGIVRELRYARKINDFF